MSAEFSRWSAMSPVVSTRRIIRKNVLRNPFIYTEATEYGLLQVIGFAFSETDFPYNFFD